MPGLGPSQRAPLPSLQAKMDGRPRIAIIGGGLAGISAAAAIKQSGNATPVVLEACSHIGGRVRHVGDGIELGAEYFHGSCAAAFQTANEFGLPMRQVFTAPHGDGGPDEEPCPSDGGVAFYYLRSEDRALRFDSADEAFSELNEALERLREYKEDRPDSESQSVGAFLRQQGVSPAMLGLAAASYSNTLGVGSALDSLPAAAIARLERLWEDDGHGDYRVADEEERRDADADGAARPRGLASLLAMLASGVDVRTGWAAAQVRQLAETSEFCVVASEDRSQPPVYADAIIVAVPVTVLQRRHLRFDPPLPPSQLAAIDSIAVQPACKVCLTFDRPPWPPSGPMAAEFAKHPVHSVLCEGMAIPELWFRDMRTTYNPVGEGSRGDLARRAECARCAGQANAWSACGFATGDYAAALMARAGSVASASAPGTRTTAVTDAAAEIMLRQLGTVLSRVARSVRHRLEGEREGERDLGGRGIQAGVAGGSAGRFLVPDMQMEDETALLTALRANLCTSHLIDWASEPFALGGYSAPSFGELAGARAAYRATACDGKIAFCGEATEDAMMTMSAAITSGRRAAAELLGRLADKTLTAAATTSTLPGPGGPKDLGKDGSCSGGQEQDGLRPRSRL